MTKFQLDAREMLAKAQDKYEADMSEVNRISLMIAKDVVDIADSMADQ